jgi:Protein of unknown function (DUF3833)
MPDDVPGLALKVLFVLVLLALGLVVAQRLFFDFMAQRPNDYAETQPPIDLRQLLSGPLVASGVIYGPTGRVATRFVADMEGNWDAEGGTLAEDFRYDTGRTQQRAWRIVPAGEGRFTATAADVVGPGEIEVSGATAVLRYRLRLPEDAGGWQVDVTDWLYLGEDGVIINRSQFRRFGILVGELVGAIRPVGE